MTFIVYIQRTGSHKWYPEPLMGLVYATTEHEAAASVRHTIRVPFKLIDLDDINSLCDRACTYSPESREVPA